MTIFAILIFVYIVGYALSFCMLRMDSIADRETYTRGAQAVCIIYSFGSWLMVIKILIVTWWASLQARGYFQQPVKPVDDKPIKPADK